MAYVFFDLAQNSNVSQSKNLSLNNFKNTVCDAQKDTFYSTDYAFCYTPFDTNIQKLILNDVAAYQKRKIKAIFILGIGGSINATHAIHKALITEIYPDIYHTIYYVETLDHDILANQLSIAEQILIQKQDILIIVGSKSGTTLETVTSFSLFVDLLKRYNYPVKNHVVIISNTHSPLTTYALQEEIHTYDIPDKVGGRYSAFTAASLFPLALMGVNIQKLVYGATYDSDYLINWAEQKAQLLYNFYISHNIRVHDLLICNSKHNALGDWFNQLIGESLGKNNTGFIPTKSLATQSFHTTLQSSLDGPPVQYTTVLQDNSRDMLHVNLHKTSENLCIPDYARNKTIDTLQHALIQSALESYRAKNRPLSIVSLGQEKTEALGAFLYWSMLMVTALSKLFLTNPFDQQAIEDYKKIIKIKLKN